MSPMERETIKDSTSKPQPHPHSYLFMLKVWAEELGDGQWEWRGQVQHVKSGETRYFRDWSTLITFLEAALPEVGVQ